MCRLSREKLWGGPSASASIQSARPELGAEDSGTGGCANASQPPKGNDAPGAGQRRLFGSFSSPFFRRFFLFSLWCGCFHGDLLRQTRCAPPTLSISWKAHCPPTQMSETIAFKHGWHLESLLLSLLNNIPFIEHRATRPTPTTPFTSLVRDGYLASAWIRAPKPFKEDGRPTLRSLESLTKRLRSSSGPSASLVCCKRKAGVCGTGCEACVEDHNNVSIEDPEG